ncbi:nucleotidyltransferase domain-containing protein [Candidatus Scalindua japonica]|uniref:nucleotidyltransferase domain-containing protein n=1 Tax=Candidatus Scalindua japonica TaxID=1284222 RepID=UPI003B967C18
MKESVSVFDKQAKVVLFSSRARDTALGGDIDLLFIFDSIKQQDLGQIRWQIREKPGEQKIDMSL